MHVADLIVEINVNCHHLPQGLQYFDAQFLFTIFQQFLGVFN